MRTVRDDASFVSGARGPARSRNFRMNDSEAHIRRLIDRMAISDVVIAYATGVDRRDWALYRSIFTDPVRIDFASWSGAPASDVAADAWVAGVKAALTPFDATHHASTNHVVTIDGDRARCVSQMMALHHLVTGDAREMHAIGGYYTNSLVRTEEGWKIAVCALTVTWEMGDRGLFARAAAR